MGGIEEILGVQLKPVKLKIVNVEQIRHTKSFFQLFGGIFISFVCLLLFLGVFVFDMGMGSVFLSRSQLRGGAWVRGSISTGSGTVHMRSTSSGGGGDSGEVVGRGVRRA